MWSGVRVRDGGKDGCLQYELLQWRGWITSLLFFRAVLAILLGLFCEVCFVFGHAG